MSLGNERTQQMSDVTQQPIEQEQLQSSTIEATSSAVVEPEPIEQHRVEPSVSNKPRGVDLTRRADIGRMYRAELAIREAMIAVEQMGASDRLTDAVVLLSQAKDKVSDHIDGVVA